FQVQVIQSTHYSNYIQAELTCRSSCRLSDSASYSWYKNGHEIYTGKSSYSSNFNYGDSYSCAVTGYEDFSSLPVCEFSSQYSPKSSSVSVSTSGEIEEGSSVTLTCSSDANPEANYTWYKSTGLKFISGGRQLVFKSIQSSDSEYYYCTAENELGKRTSDYTSINVKLVQGQNGWGVTYTSTHICALKGSTVEINCNYRYPSRVNNVDTAVDETIWFTKLSNNEPVDLRTDSEYAGRVQYHCDKNDCTLRITDLRERDSAEYKFRFTTNQPGGKYTGSPGVTLTVTDLQVQVIGATACKAHTCGLKCHSSCHLDDRPSYVWYKNGQKIIEQTSSFYLGYFYPADSYSCALKGHEMFSSPSLCLNVIFSPSDAHSMPSVSVSPSGEIIEGSSVTLTCSSDVNPAAKYTWYKKNVNPDLQPLSKEPQLVFSSIQSSDSGEYYCTAENQLGKKTSEYIFIDVKYAPKFPSVSVSPSAEIVEGSSVNLTCSSDANPAANYTWYKENEDSPKASGQIFTITDVRPEHSGNYYCEAQNRRGRHNSTLHLIVLKVAYRMPFVSVSPSSEIIEGSSVTLTCSSDDKPESNYTWYKKNLNPDLQPLSKEPQLVFSSVQSSDSGEYYCTAVDQRGKRLSENISIDVKYAPKLPSVSVSPSGEIVEGSSVTLNCSSDANPAANYTWYKENKDSPKASGQIFTITDVRPEHSGNYSCEAQNRIGRHNSTLHLTVVKDAPKLPSVSVRPSAEIVEGSSVTLTCSSDANPAANYTWYKKNVNLDLQPLSKEPQLVFSSIQSSDSGEYYCTAENQLGKRTSEYIFIDVKYAPKLPSVSVSPSAEIVEGSSVTLTCSSDANPAASYTWYKGNQKLLSGQEGKYNFLSISSEDSGIYYCKSENQYGQINSTSLFIDVWYAPKLPSVSVSPSAEIVEGSSVTLTCSSDANPAANYTWYKENEDSPKASGQIFTITDVRPEHSGNYYCEAQNRRGRQYSTLHLAVAAGAWKAIVTGTTTAVLLAIILFVVFLFIIKKWPFKQSSEPGKIVANRNEGQPEDQDDIYYASVKFSNNQADAIYSNVGPARLHRHEVEEEAVEYAAVKFTSVPRTSDQETEEDPAALYSTVNKTR
ncbi:B-cell receptor CD22-like, partial [Scomber scombrus]